MGVPRHRLFSPDDRRLPTILIGRRPRLPATPPHRLPRAHRNWRPLVQWLLAIPYLWVAGVLYWLTGVLTVVAFFSVLFTRRIPRGVFELMVPGLRWNLRGNAYAYFTNDQYPPFVWG